MRPRVVWWVGTLTLAVVLGLALLWWVSPSDPVGWHSYRRVELGMTAAEVEAVIGLPPGSHQKLAEGELLVYDNAAEASRGTRNGVKGCSWVGNAGNLTICLDAAGRVVGVTFTPLRRTNRTWLDRLRRGIGLE